VEVTVGPALNFISAAAAAAAGGHELLSDSAESQLFVSGGGESLQTFCWSSTFPWMMSQDCSIFKIE